MQVSVTTNQQVVVGLGLTGLSCARYLSRKQLPFAVVDSRQLPPGLDAFKAEFPDVSLTLGDFNPTLLANAERLVVNPGVALEEPAIAEAVAKGVQVCGDIDLFAAEAVAPIVAITGSNGKSTVTTLLGEMARQAGREVAVGGNIGVPVLDLLLADEPDLYVLELSSFQLERTADLSPAVATVLNISADHMDRYESLAAYQQAKHRIFAGAKKVVVNRADKLSQPPLNRKAQLISFGLDASADDFGVATIEGDDYLIFQSKPLMSVQELLIVGHHNIENALAALALGHAAGLEMAPMLAALKTFTGLPHRCQFVAELHGVRYYNDSKGTNVGASIAAIQGLAASAEKIVLIAGGVAKGADFSPLLPVLKQFVRAVIIIGEATPQLIELCGGSVTAIAVDSLSQAVTAAGECAQGGDAVLLSPACASFDMFNDYQHRGEQFSASVLALAGNS
ncbi:UDP-N-acetylmuramoyl-L-alanine--D-glutamate ligase [Oceanicoccus sp. KOV_DT_Chl]|uniref:UDP-N-acetylmuramoyl-L-alanine--D-glutamate ligase n=1 Tax=Oceanicoccus sp. KOV_DT_Chl TaxID=1904639 RepID=UPI000C79B26A|nr:UDP-N-acetylmuramoyl-L-alanine--D-glutamate ligase [Oceanicoccus sp. KOV_DT_Chl]